MFGKWRATTHVRDVLQEIRDALIAAHPSSPAAAETYSGLRQQITDLNNTRRRHLVRLARLSAAPHHSLPNLLAEMREEENLTEQWEGPREWFTTSSAPTPEHTLHITAPAYVTRNDTGEDTLIRQGVGEWRRV